MHVNMQDMPVDDDVQTAKGLDDLLHSPLHLCIASSEICYHCQAMLHLVDLHSMADTICRCVTIHKMATVPKASLTLWLDDFGADK